MTTYKEIINEMRVALLASIDFIKKNGDQQFIIKNGQYQGSADDSSVYMFDCDRASSIDEDADVEIHIGQMVVSGRVTGISDGHVQLSLEQNLGATIAEARLVISSVFLLVKLSEKLEQLSNGEIGHTALAEKLFELEPSDTEFDVNYVLPHQSKLNEYQESAVRLALGSDVSYIWGPPGTGKTRTIARLVEALISDGKSVLLLSHTNKATDGALASVVEYFEKTDNQDYKDGRLIRVGQILDIGLKEKYVSIDKIFEVKSKEVRAAIDKNGIQAYKLHEIINQNVIAQEVKKRVDEAHRDYDDGIALVKKYREKIALIKEQASIALDRCSATSIDIKNFQAKGKIMQLLSGTNLDKLTAASVKAKLDRDKLKAQALKYQEMLDKAHTEVPILKAAISRRESDLSHYDLLDDEEVKSINQQLKVLKSEKDNLLAELEALKEDLISKAKLIATTLTKSYRSSQILSREYDCVILDEASMAPIPALLFAAGIAKRKVVVIGDFLQLPPIAKYQSNENKEEKDLVDKWLRSDIFAYTGISKAVENGETPEKMQQLRYQWRMHPVISKLVNKLVYDNYGDSSLIDDRATFEYGAEKLGSFPLSNAHVGIYDTSELGSIPMRNESNSVFNIPHALVCLNLVQEAIESGYTHIGVISAYRAQVDLISKMLDDAYGKDSEKRKRVIAETVHKFQGDEKELIIFDVTTPRLFSMFNDGQKGGDDEKLINVAYSRAKEKLIILADVPKIMKHDDTSLIKQTIDYCITENLPIVNAADLIKRIEFEEDVEEWIKKINNAKEVEVFDNISLLNEATFYKAFYSDLKKVNNELIIFSPFITTNRASELKPIFSSLLSKGVNVYVFTRPWEEHEGLMQDMAKKEMLEFENMGMVVLPMIGKTHEKAAILDRSVFYFGSLNILSQRDSHEDMYRFASKGHMLVDHYLAQKRIIKNIGKSMENNELKHCDTCNKPGAWYWESKTFYGPWYHCLAGLHVPGKPPKERKTTQQRDQEVQRIRDIINLNENGVPICPEHNIVTILRPGKPPYGDYYACPRNRECKYNISVARAKTASRSPRPIRPVVEKPKPAPTSITGQNGVSPSELSSSQRNKFEYFCKSPELYSGSEKARSKVDYLISISNNFSKEEATKFNEALAVWKSSIK